MPDTVLRLIVFDCDGTLVDSQPSIVRTMAAAFERHGLHPPPPGETARIIGLELSAGIAALLPEGTEQDPHELARTYRDFARPSLADPDTTPRPFEGELYTVVPK